MPPTTDCGDVWIDWDPDRLEVVLVQAADESPDLPEGPAVVTDGPGWEAVAPADRSSNMKRSDAEKWEYEILGSLPPWIDDVDEDDLVAVDAESVQ